MERSLEARTGYPWEIGTLNWTPNGNFHVYDARAELGDGAFTIDEILLDPSLLRMSKGRVSFSSIELVKPALDLSEAWLLEQLEKERVRLPDNASARPPVVASNENRAGSQSERGTAGKNLPKVAGAEVLRPTGKKVEVKPLQEAAQAEEELFEYPFDAWLNVSDASVTLRKSDGKLMSLDGINAKIPFGGKDLVGEVSCDRVVLLEREILQSGKFNVHKKGPVLSVVETEVDFFGVQMKPEIYLVRAIDGLHLFADLVIPEQAGKELITHLNLTVGVAVNSVKARFQLFGALNRPQTWRGVADLKASGLTAAEGHRGSVIRFDDLVLQSDLAHGVWNVASLQAMSEDLSIMSNGAAAMNGQGFGVVRVVSSPEKRQWIERLGMGSEFFVGTTWGLMRSLNTNDRYYMDVKFDGEITNPSMKLDGITDWQPVWPAIKRLKKFVEEERSEELP